MSSRNMEEDILEILLEPILEVEAINQICQLQTTNNKFSHNGLEVYKTQVNPWELQVERAVQTNITKSKTSIKR